jgi:hypothetical protein
MIEWREGANPKILLIDGASTSHEIDGQTMRDADVVACVPDDETVHIVKDTDGVARAVTGDQWLALVTKRLKHRRNGQVIQVDADDVRRREAA